MHQEKVPFEASIGWYGDNLWTQDTKEGLKPLLITNMTLRPKSMYEAPSTLPKVTSYVMNVLLSSSESVAPTYWIVPVIHRHQARLLRPGHKLHHARLLGLRGLNRSSM